MAEDAKLESMALEWNRLRSWNGSQESAFEELCCQLAASDNIPAGAKFLRKGTPDAGVECFWQLTSGDEWAWQAKFFLSPPTANQWKEIDSSVKTALGKHPRLTRYIICLPIDRPDPRVKEQQSFLDKWNQRVAKWKRWGDQKKTSVEFKYWGQSEIFERLSREEHRGCYWFWFNQEHLSLDWFRKRLEEAINNAGARYTAELNVEVPVSKHFDALGRTKAFVDENIELHKALNKSYSDLDHLKKHEEFQPALESLNPLLSGRRFLRGR